MPSPKPPAEPDPTAFDPEKPVEALYQEALSLCESIQKLTDTLLEAGQKPMAPDTTQTLSQWVMQRGHYVERLTRLLDTPAIARLSTAQREALEARIGDFQRLGPQVSDQLNQAAGQIDRQMQSLRQGKQLLKHYHLPVEGEQHGRHDQDV